MKCYLKMLLLYAAVVSFLSHPLFSQGNVDFKKGNFKENKEAYFQAMENIYKGDEYSAMGGGAYRLALECYLKAQELNPDNDLLNYKIGVCYLNSVQKEKSMEHFLKAVKLNPNVANDIHYMIGRGYHLKGQFDLAIEEYHLFYQSLKSKDKKEWETKVNKRIEECKYGKEFIANPVKVKIENIGNAINSSYPDYRPLISADESMMIFTSRRENTTGKQRAPWDNEYYEDLYIAINKEGVWQPAENPGKPMNSIYHEAGVGLSNDGQQLFFYKDDGKNGGDIYLCILNGEIWSTPKALPKTINTLLWESSASLSFDGNALYFVSNKQEGSFGGRDIYVSYKDQKGKWGPAINLGDSINTPYEEESVFIHPDGRTLYFSSQGHNSMGGFDIFNATLSPDSTWKKPVNMGYPINNTDDDLFFVVSASGRNAYFSSVREQGVGEKDIYRIIFEREEEEKKETGDKEEKQIVARLTLLKGIVKDAETQKPLEAKIEIVDNKEDKIITTITTNSASGKYLISLPSGKNYGIAVSADNYLFHSENFNISDTAAFQEVIKDIFLQKINVGSKVILNNIFFDFDKSTLRPESMMELNRLVELLNNYSAMKIEISGHTDNKGSLEYNTNLSQSRAKAVVDYLIQKGIDANRLSYKGYAFTEPIATNDTEEGRQLNRRVEFKIIKTN